MSKGLLTLQTDLKSLRYGNDKPYVTKDINDAPSSNQTGMQAIKRVDDLSRVAQMLIDRPGLKHLGNEALLHQIGVQDRFEKSRKSGKSVAGALLKELGGTALTTVKVVGSTIAQVPVNGTGTHFLRGFRTDTYLQPTNGNHFSQFASFFGAGGVEGAPSAIKGREIVGTIETALLTDTRSSNFDYTGEDVLLDRNEKLNVPTGSNQAKINAINGKRVEVAPSGSGIGNTTSTPGGMGGSRSNQLDKISQSEFVKVTGDDTKISGNKGTDYLFDPIIPTEYTYLTQKQAIKSRNGNITKESRLTLGDQGAPSTDAQYQTARKTNKYWIQSDGIKGAEIDKLNALAERDVRVNGNTEGRDIIKFRFNILTPEGEHILYFRAYLDSFADNFSGQWNPVKYLGRAEDFQVYGGFQRKINLSFKIAASTRAEMKSIYRKMVYLASATAPTYTGGKDIGGQFMRGTLTKITVGDYVYELPGVLNSVNYTWNTEYPWEIAMSEPEQGGDADMQELPMVMDCSIDFTPIHTFTPTTGIKDKYFTAGTTEANNFLK